MWEKEEELDVAEKLEKKTILYLKAVQTNSKSAELKSRR